MPVRGVASPESCWNVSLNVTLPLIVFSITAFPKLDLFKDTLDYLLLLFSAASFVNAYKTNG